MEGRELSENSSLDSHGEFSFNFHVACFNNLGECLGFPGSLPKLNIINIETLGQIQHRLEKGIQPSIPSNQKSLFACY